MVMVSGAIGLYRKGGRSPPPKRGRPGGGRCAAAPYKHRLAHAPGRQSRSGRAFRCVGVLGQSPKRVLVPFTRVKGTPRRRAVLIMPCKRLTPPSGARKLFHTPAAGDCKTLPRRVGVPIKSFITLAPPEVIADFFTNAPPAGVQIRITKRLAPPKVTADFFTPPTTAQKLPQPSGQGSLSSYSLIYASFRSPFSRLISSSSSTR